MVTIGNDTLPGTIKIIESAASTGANLGAPGVPVLIGQAYLDEGDAAAAEMKRISRPKQARDEFGPPAKSLLTTAVQDALVEGAYPVYAIAAEETELVDEDISGESGTGATLANRPVVEVADDIEFNINGTTKTTELFYDGDPANIPSADFGSDRVYLNPQTGKYEADESLGSSGDTVTYKYVDYTTALDEVTNAKTANDQFLREVADFVVPVDENDTVVADVESKVSDMESNGWLSIGTAGAGDPYIDDLNTTLTDEIGSFSHSYDTSRLQLYHPSRNDDNETLAGSYAGLRSRVGIDRSPIFTRMRTQEALRDNLTTGQQEDLVLAGVIPISEEGGGAKIMEDLTTVTGSNTEEEAWTQGSARLITDFVADIVDEESEPFIGEFNNTAVQNSIRGNISDRLGSLLESRTVEAYSIVVEEIDDVTLAVDIGIDTADPLRNIEITLAAGAVQNGVSIE